MKLSTVFTSMHTGARTTVERTLLTWIDESVRRICFLEVTHVRRHRYATNLFSITIPLLISPGWNEIETK